MTLFRRLINAATSVDSLSLFLSENIQLFYDLHNSNIVNLNVEKQDIRNFLDTKRLLLEKLDFSSNTNKSFVSILFDFAERFGLLSIIAIENTLVRNNLYLGERRQAAKLFLLHIRNNNDYLNRFNEICTLLQSSLATEEESDKNVLATFSNYYSKVIIDTSLEYAQALKEKVVSSRNDRSFNFLQNDVISKILAISFENISAAYDSIHKIIDEIYDRHITITAPPVTGLQLLIETDAEYLNLLNGNADFATIRGIAVQKCGALNTVNFSRYKATTPLKNNDDLFIYLYRYGKMHKAKLESAFNATLFNEMQSSYQLIDWGCGQGLASTVFFDYLRNTDIDLNISNITLIEPSILAIKRAALHVQCTTNSQYISTICKPFNNLILQDLPNDISKTKIHIFSNILDIGEDFYSQKKLIEIIKQTQKGNNIFFCCSPFITDFETNRIDNFVNSFKLCPGFRLITKIDNRKETWVNGWSRVIRVFKATL